MERNIGDRQRWSWIGAGVSAAAAVCLCSYNWLWVAAGGTAAALYYIYMEKAAATEGLSTLIKAGYGKLAAVPILLTMAWHVFVMGWAADLAAAAFPTADGFPVLGWVMLAMAAWGSRKGPAACAGCCGVLSLFLMVLYGVVVLFSLPDVQWEHLETTGQWQDSIWCAGLVLSGTAVWYLPGKNVQRKRRWTAVLLPMSFAVLAAITAGVLSPELVKVRTVPLYDVAQSVSLFGVVERIESLLSAAITMGVFSLLAAMANACQSLGSQLKLWEGYGVVCCTAAGFAMFLRQWMTAEIITAGGWIVWFGIPLVAVVLCRVKRVYL